MKNILYFCQKKGFLKENHFFYNFLIIFAEVSKICHNELKYDKGDKYAFGDLDILQEAKIIVPYTQTFMKNSLTFPLKKNGKDINIEGYLLHSRYKGSRKEGKQNNCYLLKTTILDSYVNIKKDIIIKSKKSFFKEIYEVQSDDTDMKDKIITEKFMNKLLEISEKTNKRYDFLFRDNCFYIKWNIGGINLYINIATNLAGTKNTFIDWYVEMRKIVHFVEDIEILDSFN